MHRMRRYITVHHTDLEDYAGSIQYRYTSIIPGLGPDWKMQLLPKDMEGRCELFMV